MMKSILAAIIAVTLGTVFLLSYQPIQKIRTNNEITPIISTQAIPTPIRTESPIATQSAFLALKASISSLSAALLEFTITDPSLTPPAIDVLQLRP